jgi:hypothetical protein
MRPLTQSNEEYCLFELVHVWGHRRSAKVFPIAASLGKFFGTRAY